MELDKVVCFFQEVLLFPRSFAASLTAVITCVLCALGSCSAVLGNSLVIAAFCRNKELQTISNCFLISLTCTDLLVGIVVEPLYIARQSFSLSGTDHCGIWVAYLTMALFCTGASFLNVALISCERYLAIFWPFFYASTATKWHVIAVIGSLWVSWVLLTAVRFLGVPNRTIYLIVFAIIGISLVGTAVIYVRIFREARRHQKVIATLQTCSGPNAQAKDTKLAKTVLLVFGALLVCYTPGMIILLVRTIKGDTPALLYVAYPWAETSIFINSSLNPLIYCWRNRDIRNAVFRLVGPLRRRVDPEASVTNVATVMNYSVMKAETPKPVRYNRKPDTKRGEHNEPDLQSISSKENGEER